MAEQTPSLAVLYAAKQMSLLREERRLTQLELANRLWSGSGRKSFRALVSNWERGEKTFNVDDLTALSRAFGVPVSTFILDRESPEMVH